MEKLTRYEAAVEALKKLGLDVSAIDQIQMVGTRGYYVYEPGTSFAGEIIKVEELPIMGQPTMHFQVRGRTDSFVAYGDKDAPPQPFEGDFKVTLHKALENFLTPDIKVGSTIGAVCHGTKTGKDSGRDYFDCDPFKFPSGFDLWGKNPLPKPQARIAVPPQEAPKRIGEEKIPEDAPRGDFSELEAALKGVDKKKRATP